ncbi:MAG: hypothetical protein OXC06_07865 [Acidimicrobiaceae bacterium]|nr:hypothetical protein [Acidimicrobiaceae bacterium]
MTARLRSLLNVVVALAFVAAACGGEVADSDDTGVAAPTTRSPAADGAEAPEPDEPDGEREAPATTEPEDDTADTGGRPTTEPADEEPSGPAPNIYDDPRDGIFDEFQATMDRGDHPFMQIDRFCVAHDPAPGREATDKGIEADSVSVVHIRSKLEQLMDIGFGIDVGDTTEMFETFAAVVNEQCGGVRGRMIDLHTVDVGVLTATVDEDNNAACIEAIEDHDAVVVVNSSSFRGSASLCIVEQHETAFVSVQSQSAQFMERGEDRLITVSTVAEEQLSWMVLDLIAAGRLDGRTVGVAVEDTPGHYEAVEAGLVQTLIDGGVDVAVFDVIGCGGSNVCLEGTVESVQRLRLEGVDVFFNLLNVISAPLYLAEMVVQGFEPGDVQFYASDFESQATELVASKIVQVGGAAVGDLYNGAIISDFRDTGAYRVEGFEPRAFDEMCNDTYGAHSPSGANHEAHERADGNERYGMTATVCELMRITLRGIHDAGDNPARADIYASLASLGPVDSSGMYPASLRPGKTRTPDVIHNLVFEFPCTKPSPFPVPGHDHGICLYPIDEYRPVPS